MNQKFMLHIQYLKIFTLKGKKYETVDYSASQWRKGLYDIEIPDAPHGVD